MDSAVPVDEVGKGQKGEEEAKGRGECGLKIKVHSFSLQTAILKDPGVLNYILCIQPVDKERES